MVPKSEQARIAGMPEEDLINLQFGLGMWIRNNLGLWETNPELLAATGQGSADDASEVIIRAFWVAIRGEQPKIH